RLGSDPFRKLNRSGRALKQQLNRPKFHVRPHQALNESLAEPQDNGLMRRTCSAVCSGTPGMRNLRPDQDQVSIFVSGHAVSGEALSATVQGESQLVLAVVMPFEWNRRQPPVK